MSAAHASLVARYGSDADMRAMALTTAEATVRRRRALDDLGAAHARLRAAEGSLDAARRINVRLFLFGFGLERHDALVLSASTDLLHAVQSLQVAATREPSLAVDPAPLAVDLSDPFARSFPGRVIGAVLPRALRGLATTALTFGRLQRARAVVGDVLDAVATRRHAPEALVVAAAA